MVWNSNFDIYPICTRGRLYLGCVNPSQCVGGHYWASLSRPFHSISFCLCISCFSFMAIGYCHLTIISLHQATITSGSALHHLGCTWHAGSQKTGSGLSSHPLQTWVTLHHLINLIFKLRVRAKPPLCEHDISCILGLRQGTYVRITTWIFNLYLVYPCISFFQKQMSQVSQYFHISSPPLLGQCANAGGPWILLGFCNPILCIHGRRSDNFWFLRFLHV